MSDLNILIVDDDNIFRENLRELLLHEGFSTTSVSSGIEAVDLISSCHFNLVITDLKMPKMNGIEVIEAIRKAHPDLPVILMTAYGGPNERREALEHNASHFITKPFEIDDMVSIINTSLECAG